MVLPGICHEGVENIASGVEIATSEGCDNLRTDALLATRDNDRHLPAFRPSLRRRRKHLIQNLDPGKRIALPERANDICWNDIAPRRHVHRHIVRTAASRVMDAA